MIVRGQGIALDAPAGWDVRIAPDPDPDSEPDLAVVHLANFALPAGVGGFGGEAIDAMPDHGIVVSILEYEPALADQPHFAGPRRFSAPFRLRELDPRALIHGRPYRAGAQRFAVVEGRPLCVYLVVGVVPSPARLLRDANRVLGTVTVAARDA